MPSIHVPSEQCNTPLDESHMEDYIPLYHGLIDNPKVQRLSGDTFKFWINLLCLANQSDVPGLVDLDTWEIAWRSRIPEQDARRHLDALIKTGLVHDGEDGLWVQNWTGREE